MQSTWFQEDIRIYGKKVKLCDKFIKCDKNKNKNKMIIKLKVTSTLRKQLLTLLLMACKNAAFPTFCNCFDICDSNRRFSFSMCRLFSSNLSRTELNFESSTNG